MDDMADRPTEVQAALSQTDLAPASQIHQTRKLSRKPA